MAIVGSSSRRVWVQVPAQSHERMEANGSEWETLSRVVVAGRAGPGKHPWDEAHQLIRDLL